MLDTFLCPRSVSMFLCVANIVTCCACHQAYTQQDGDARMCACPVEINRKQSEDKHTCFLQRPQQTDYKRRKYFYTSQPFSLATSRRPCPRKRKKHQTLSLHLVCLHAPSELEVCPPSKMTREIHANPNSCRRRVPGSFEDNLQAILSKSSNSLPSLF